MALVESFSGIRGIYDRDFTDSIAVRYAYAFCSFVRENSKKNCPTIVIGRDTRPSGAKIIDDILGILDCNFIDAGIAPTPAVEFAVRHFDADGGIIVTASHNEPNWNGFKFLANDGSVLNEISINQVIRNFRLKSFINFHKVQERKIFKKNAEVMKGYIDFILNIIDRTNIEKIRNSKLRVVLDPNGGTGVIAKRIMEQIGVEAAAINAEYGSFARTVEPTEDSLSYLKKIIVENEADFAAGFDCDADRVEILLGNGQLLSGNYAIALIADELLSHASNPEHNVIVVNDATSNVVRDVVEKFGAKIKEVEAGETNVVKEMDKSKAIVGGEGSSCGVILPPSKCRDGILTLLMILSIVANKQKKLEELIYEMPKYYTLRKKIGVDSSKHNSTKKYLKGYYSKKGFKIKESGGIKGGLKVITDKNSFVWFRASKTESDVFRIISDSNNEEQSKRLMEEAVNIFNKANE
ncbi:MAG: hypothetical protein AABX33_02110 [Nanoarchaeota archaeon]